MENYELMDFASISDKTLEEIINKALEERTNRKEKNREKAWREVVSAMRKYIEEFGEIVHECRGEEFYINEEDDFTEPGIIMWDY